LAKVADEWDDIQLITQRGRGHGRRLLLVPSAEIADDQITESMGEGANDFISIRRGWAQYCGRKNENTSNTIWYQS